nr:reverse transcriptase domain-containing protein [Tanacetum cinerariifolium]
MDGCTKGSQLEEDENLNNGAPRTGRTPLGVTSAPAGQTQEGPSPAFVKKDIDSHADQKSRAPSARKNQKSVSKKKGISKSHRKSSSDSGYDTMSDSGSEDLSRPYRRPKPMPFTSRITRFRYHRRGKLPPNVRVYEGNKDPEDHLSIFSATADQEEWPMPVLCKMFRHTLSGSKRNWFDSLDPKSVDGFEELNNKFLEEFLQQKRYDNDPMEIHGIKRKPNEGLQAFMDRFKAESIHVKGVPPVLRIYAFMHGHDHPKLAKNLNDKISKIVDKTWKRVRAFIRGESAEDTTEVIRSPRWEKNADRGHNTNECYHLKKQIEEAVASGRLAHLVKDIRQGSQKSKGSTKGKEKVINMVRSQGYRKRPYERVEHRMDNAITFPSMPQYRLMNLPVAVEAMIEGFRVRRIHVDGGSSSEVMYDHCFRNLSYRTRSRLRES